MDAWWSDPEFRRGHAEWEKNYTEAIAAHKEHKKTRHMKALLLALSVAFATLAQASRMIYNDGITRREIVPPVMGYLVLDSIGNFSQLPDLRHGEAMILFSDGIHLRYSIIREPTKDKPTIVYENGEYRTLESDTSQTHHFKPSYVPTQAKTQQQIEDEMKRMIEDRLKAHEYHTPSKTDNADIYDELKRKQNLELKAWGYDIAP